MDTRTQAPNAPVRILIAEDSPTQAQRLQHILEQQGYAVGVADNGRLALDMVSQFRPALIISDVVMPEMDGYSLCRHIKADADLRDIPIILVTTMSDPQDVICGLECGADNFVLKPYDEHYLLGRVRYVLLNREMRQADETGMGVEIYFNGERHFITADRLQILNLLLSTYDAAIQRNKELNQSQKAQQQANAKLNELTQELEERVQQQTQALRESEARVRLTIDTALDGVVIMDAQGIICDWNAQAEAIFGWKRDAAVGNLMSQLIIPPQYREAHERGLKHFLATGEGPLLNRRIEITALHQEGHEFPVELSLAAMTVKGASMFSGFARDITERQQAEEKIRRLNDELEERVQERTAQLEASNAELIQAKATAEEANQTKSAFLSSMSHELRTPLNAILGFGQILASTSMPSTPEQKKDFINHIVKAGRHLLVLINEVLDLAQVESGTLTLSTEPVALAEVLLECQEMIEPLAKDRNIRMLFPPSDSLHVLADSTRLKQIFLNLLSNAIKYNRVDGTVVVACTASTAEHVRISIQDTGAGLSPEKLGQLFQPFNRLGQEAGVEEGTGIGLVMTKRLIELMGGTIGVTSTVGIGSVFWVELPSTAAMAHAVANSMTATISQEAMPPVEVGQANMARHTLLYVEDNPANLELVEQIISFRPDLRLLTAVEGKLGIELARAHQPDVILMDINLPGMSGNEALLILRNDPKTAHIPVIALTANAMPKDVAESMAHGFFRYVIKPINIDDFFDVLDSALEFSSHRHRQSKVS